MLDSLLASLPDICMVPSPAGDPTTSSFHSIPLLPVPDISSRTGFTAHLPTHWWFLSASQLCLCFLLQWCRGLHSRSVNSALNMCVLASYFIYTTFISQSFGLQIKLGEFSPWNLIKHIQADTEPAFSTGLAPLVPGSHTFPALHSILK